MRCGQSFLEFICPFFLIANVGVLLDSFYLLFVSGSMVLSLAFAYLLRIVLFFVCALDPLANCFHLYSRDWGIIFIVRSDLCSCK
ncbi:hypothetical protein BJ508DRAFT_18987 [Ascobolus immersus RN42]|uniref:Uncharacterized protein n=1 Tax=Ascobolus immersus RN42 TaxID=1160509 RepID=A0A3N4HRB6_ASCIM|nr:hypothetical protein BJ508DRAFT_18987 [Ascobolus immersus RN42]